ncbi:aldo/keto reductase [Streptomyces sp. NEAU-YJ-81]|uniref:aldo/keto reductase n=1 Tax=Streptomyces sp. NEAU-YJ-81 TaxID=2820288 RepID=UPI0035B20F58
MALADEVRAIADGAGATPVQVALAWLLAKGEHIVPIPGTKRAARVEENTAADTVELTAEQLAKLDSLPPAVGHDENEEVRRRIER